MRLQSWYLAIAIAIYCLLGALAIAQHPGLQYDEALLVSGAVHMRHSPNEFDLLATPDSWVCPIGRCIPLMSALYVGAVKDYTVLPFVAAFGPKTSLIRMVSLLLSALCLWGIYRLVAEFFGPRAAFASALVIAVNPAFLYMAVFDNNAIGAMMAGLGLTCGCLGIYHARRSFRAALLLGLALGFSVWARANIVWVLAAGFAAGLVVFRRRFLIPVTHWGAIVLGGLAGSFPFLVFQILSNGATWKAQGDLSVNTPMATLVRQRIFWFADMLLSDGEHRRMWNGPPLPQWQLWLFPVIVLAACLMCLMAVGLKDPGRRAFARSAALTFLLAGAVLLFSGLPVAEHHLIMLLPICVVMVILAGSILGASLVGRALCAAMFLIYISSAAYWQFAGISGLRTTGGVGPWSNAGTQLAAYLQQNLHGRRVRYLDWALRYNMYVLSDAKVKGWEVYLAESEQADAQGRPWLDLIRDGGVFVLNGADNRVYSKPSAGFLHALAINRPTRRTYRVLQRNGETYAEVIDIEPNSVRGPLAAGEGAVDRLEMGDARAEDRLTGFHQPEDGRYRWTKREFSARFNLSGLDKSDAQLVMRVYVPDSTIRELGSITLSASIGGHALPPATWSQPGEYVYRRELEADWMPSGPIQVNFSLNKAASPTAADPRERGIVVTEISVEPF